MEYHGNLDHNGFVVGDVVKVLKFDPDESDCRDLVPLGVYTVKHLYGFIAVEYPNPTEEYVGNTLKNYWYRRVETKPAPMGLCKFLSERGL